MAVSSTWDLSSDAEVITAVRSGDSAAFGVLYERHVSAARSVARQYSNSAADAEDAVSDAFARVFTAIQGGGGPDVAFRAYLFTVLRRVALERVESGKRAIATDDLGTFEAAAGLVESTEEPTLAGFERGVVSRAYSSLPERWQAVLWYTEVEELSPAEIAPVLGLTANGVAALAYRAREGLRQAYLQQHLAAPESEACVIVNKKLGAYVRGGLAKRETLLVDSHLEECGTCRALVLELGDVNHGMRLVIAPLVLGAVALVVLKGLGFGGAAGALAGAGAAGGSAAGTGTSGAGTSVGVGAGSTTSAGSLVGAGAAVSGMAVVGIGAAGLAGATDQVASAPLASAPASGGFSGLLGSMPVGAIGMAAAGVVVAGAVAVAGVLGVFTGGGPEETPTAVEATGEPTADEDADGPATDADEDPADGTGDPTDTGTSDPADTATDEPSTPGGTTSNPSGTTSTGTDTDAPDPDQPPSNDPDPDQPPSNGPDPDGPDPDGPDPDGPDPDNPDPDNPDPDNPDPDNPDPDNPDPGTDSGVVSFSAIPDVTLTAGIASLVNLEVANGGGAITGEVRTDFLFEEGVEWSLTADAVPLGAMGMAVGALGEGWSCIEVSTVMASCSREGLAAASTSTLVASMLVDDPTVDLDTSVVLGLRTWVPDLGTAPAFTTVTAPMTSQPALLDVQQPVVDVLVSGEAGPLVVPIGNLGRTTARGVEATVDLPAGVTGSLAAGSGWACTGTAVLDCSLDTLAPGADGTLSIELTAQVAALRVAGAALGTAEIRVALGQTESVHSAELTGRSAPAAFELGFTDGPLISGPRTTTVTLSNIGGWDAENVQLSALLPEGVSTAAGSTWSAAHCAVAVADQVCLPRIDALLAGADLAPQELRLVVLPNTGVPSLPVVITVSGTSEGVAVSETITGQVATTQSAALAVTASPLTLGQHEWGEVTFVVDNVGDLAVDDLSVQIAGPPSVFAQIPVRGTPGWACEDPGPGSKFLLTCSAERIDPAERRQLSLMVRGRVSGAFQVALVGSSPATGVAVRAEADLVVTGRND